MEYFSKQRKIQIPLPQANGDRDPLLSSLIQGSEKKGGRQKQCNFHLQCADMERQAQR